ncbi:MAG: sigma-70 family RNA polymerase sigma factor [Planctomycetota bacterium]|nr:sigma-70 family RNA polymerase sigma factor [Planctomycetota bacterium]
MAESPFEDLPDADLVRRILKGEQALYAEIIGRYQHRLRAAIGYRVCGRDEIEEFLQETFVQAYQHLARYQPEAPLYPWLKAIAMNSLKMEFRRLQTARRRGDDYLRFVQLSRVEDEPAEAADEPRAEALKLCLERLSAPEASLLKSKYAEGISVRDLAARFKATEGALKVRLLRLREALKDCIGKRLAGERR